MAPAQVAHLPEFSETTALTKLEILARFLWIPLVAKLKEGKEPGSSELSDACRAAVLVDNFTHLLGMADSHRSIWSKP